MESLEEQPRRPFLQRAMKFVVENGIFRGDIDEPPTRVLFTLHDKEIKDGQPGG